MGYLSASCLLDAEEVEASSWIMREPTRPENFIGECQGMERGQAVDQEVLNKALKYAHHCRDHPKYEPR